MYVCLLPVGMVLDLNKSLHNQGILEKEHVVLVYDPSSAEEEVVLVLTDPAKTEGAITCSESVISSDV